MFNGSMVLGVLGMLGVLAAPAAAQPGQVPVMPPELPAGATRAMIVSTGEAQWDVRLDNNAVCTTPCTVVVEPLRYVTLYSQERTPSRLELG